VEKGGLLTSDLNLFMLSVLENLNKFMIQPNMNLKKHISHTAVLLLALSPVAASGDTKNWDVNIKGMDPRKLPFNTVVTSTTPPNTKILYDRASEGDMCAITCNFYNGVTSKWTDFYLYLQPFENFCMFFTGCSSQYPLPSESIAVITGEKRFVIKMQDPNTNSYYLPLALRKTLKESNGKQISIEIAGIKMPTYRIGEENTSKIAEIVNGTEELLINSGQPTSSKEERLKEIGELRKKGLISQEEYERARLKIISD